MGPRSRAVVLLLLAAFAGCRDGATGPAQRALELSVSGWLERGATVRLDVRSGGDPVAPGRVTWSAEPASAAEFLAGGLARLLQTGRLEITARVDDREATNSLTVALPPYILFDDRVAGNRDIFRVRLDGTDRERITEDPADDADPTAGGGDVVFSSLRDGNAELYRIATGDIATRLTTTPDADERQPALSRDGAHLAFARAGEGTERVWTRSMLSSDDELRVTDGLDAESTIEVSPSWSPSTDRLVLTSIARGEADVWTVAATGSEASLLVGSGTAEVEPAWHPTEEKVAYAAVVVGGDTELFVADLAEGIARLTSRSGPDGQPAWLPDGRIVFTAWTGSGTALMWLDPADPELLHEIPLQDGEPRNPFGIY